VEAARKNGAAGAVVERPVETGHPFSLIQVPDSLKALHDLAASIRKESATHFVGITGSSGKTSTKEFTAVLLAQKYSVFKSEGNLNSITGMPLSLLSFEEQDCGVFEVGMNQPGEISSLSRLLKPQTGVLLNVNPVHLGQFESLDAVADEKFSLTQGMNNDSVLIYNIDDPRLKERASSFSGKTISFGSSENADLSLRNVRSSGVRGNRATLNWKGDHLTFETPLCGIGNLYNITAAAAVCFHLNLSMQELQRGIAELKPYSQRGILIHLDGIDIYDDSYNSNPKALEIALDLIAESSDYKRKIIVIGDMLELGPREVEYHKAAGRQISSRAFDALITAGPLSRYTAETAEDIKQVHVMENSEAAGEKAAEIIREGDLVLVKGSRGMKMEKVIEIIRNRSAAVSGRGGQGRPPYGGQA
jgi:UDP-N-acetylmuramoyl-tripeptide--D-alanyl-D-alanine ligase